MADLELPPDFKEFLKLLNLSGAKYLLIGGYAVNLYGHLRATNDLDVWIATSRPNAEKVLGALREFGFGTPAISRSLFEKPDQIIRMGEPPMRIEVLTTISGVDFKECYARRVMKEIEDLKIPLIHLEDLRANKKASGRLKDLDDLDNLPNR